MHHDFKKWPELTNRQMEIYYFDSPHKQITEDFSGRVIKVHDGDTITVNTSLRELPVKIRFADTAAPELNQEGGHEAQSWLEKRIMGEMVDVLLSEQRVEKWGRILGTIYHNGMNVGEEEIQRGLATAWEEKDQGKIISPFTDFWRDR